MRWVWAVLAVMLWWLAYKAGWVAAVSARAERYLDDAEINAAVAWFEGDA